MSNDIGVPAMVFLHAHPDDESILTGATLAKAAAAGIRTVVVFGTRGDAGETKLDRVREAEAASAHLRVDRVEWLGHADSGMAGNPTIGNPAAFSEPGCRRRRPRATPVARAVPPESEVDRTR